MAKKVNKSIGLTKDTRRVLTLQAIDLDIDLKLHCENILEEAAKNGVDKVVVKEEAQKPPEKKKTTAKKTAEKKAPKKGEKDNNVAENSSEDKSENEEVVEKNVVEKEVLPTDPKHFDTSGAFKRLEKENKIYTNGKCFEYRFWNKEDGIVKWYYKTVEEAVEARDKMEDK